MDTNTLDEQTKLRIEENLAAVRAAIEKAAKEAGRDPDEILLLAATKTVPVEQINYAAERGLTDIGENKVQELLAKYDGYDKEKLRIHFIGRLQKNKVKYIVDKVCLIHSLDSIPLAEEIEKQAAKRGITMDVLVEVNSGREENKGGVLPEELPAFLADLRRFPHVRLRGLMTIGPNLEEKSAYIKYFRETYQIFLDIFEKKPHNKEGVILSMGMSDSFEQAICCGSSLVRIGSAIFGKRVYTTDPT